MAGFLPTYASIHLARASLLETAICLMRKCLWHLEFEYEPRRQGGRECAMRLRMAELGLGV